MVGGGEREVGGGGREPRRMAGTDHMSPRHEGARPFVVLGVTAGIAAYKAVEVCRRLVDAGLHVAPVLTENATRFVGVATFDALASERTHTSLWHDDSAIPHTRLGQRADVVVVAPATADLIAAYAGGFAGDLLTATLLATTAPVVLCPAMHTEMWEHPAVQRNLSVLRARGVTVVPPEDGRLAGGDEGAGRLADPETIAGRRARSSRPSRPHRPAGPWRSVRRIGGGLGRRDPRGHRPRAVHRQSVVGQAGSCGRQRRRPPGRRGGPRDDRLPADDKRVTIARVETAAEMEHAVLGHAETADVVVMAAAVADFRPKSVAVTKIHKDDGVPDLLLESTPDILAELGQRRRPGQVLVGFAAETPVEGEGLRSRAAVKLMAKGVDLMVANDVSRAGVGFEHDTNEVTVLGADGTVSLVTFTSKEAVADAILDRVVERLAHR